jgi:predicted NUDIX family phosphoesterase
MKYAESILVVPRVVLEAAGYISDIPGVMPLSVVGAVAFEQLVHEQQLFFPRAAMEVDSTYKQIIPYMVFVYQRQLFMMQRSASAGEQRLANAYTIGIGGHVRQSDVATIALKEWGTREFMEEIAYAGVINAVQLMGLVNDDTNAVGRVHLGVVLVMHGSTDCVAVRSELQSGTLMSRSACAARYEHMETWSKLVFDALVAAELI